MREYNLEISEFTNWVDIKRNIYFALNFELKKE